MTPQDIAVVRDLIVHAHATGWDHDVYGDSSSREHVWRLREPGVRYTAKVTWDGDTIIYFTPGDRRVKATLTSATAYEARAWLRLLGVLPSVARIAETGWAA